MKKYESYKDSGIEWIGEIPSHWEVKRGKDVLKFINGYPFNSGLFSMDENEGFPLVRIRDLKSDKITTFYKGEIVSDALINDNDFIIGMDGDFNIVKWNKGKALLNQRLCKIEGVNHLETNYLSYSLPFYLKIINDLTYYTTVKHLSNNDLFEQKFLVPNSQEQTTIANYLDQKTTQIDHLISKKKQFIQLLEEERVAVINQAVTKGLDLTVPMKDSGIEWLGEIPEHWKVKKLKYFADVVLGKMLTNDDKGGYQLKPYLRAKNIEWINPNVDDVKEMWFSENEIIQYRIKENDLLVSEGGEVGRTCIWHNQLEESYIQNSVHKVTILEGESNYFLNQFVLFGKYGHFDAIVNKISIAHLTKEKLKDISFIVPSIDEQSKISKFITNKTSEIDNIISKSKQEIELLKEYKTALISEVVTGKVDVRDEKI